ncbi:hypothetical protein CWB80_22320, partial [Pseudoalteromonas sp. S1650]
MIASLESSFSLANLRSDVVPVFLAGCVLIAFICAFCVTQNSFLWLSLVVNGVVGLAILSLGMPWLVLLVSASVSFH